jgi:hypothetical protein
MEGRLVERLTVEAAGQRFHKHLELAFGEVCLHAVTSLHAKTTLLSSPAVRCVHSAERRVPAARLGRFLAGRLDHLRRTRS